MRYLMVYKPADGSGESEAPPTAEEEEKMGAFIGEMAGAGYLVTADGLRPSSHGVRVRQTNGQVKVTDGPFTESKELIAGYAIVEVPSRDIAIDIARKFLAVAGDGESEIRLMHDTPAFEPA